jgi:hypothetical protein
VDLDAPTALAYADKAFDAMLEVAARLGDDRANERPLGPHTNSVASLIVHSCGVAEFWLGHVGVGRDDHRQRDLEFTTRATVAELRDRVAATVTQLDLDLDALEAGAQSPYDEARMFLPGNADSAAALVLHVLEELYQHLGHCEIAADALTAPGGAAAAP